MKWIISIFIFFKQALNEMCFSFLGIYSKQKRAKAMKIIASWNKIVYILFLFFTSVFYFYIISYFIEIISPYLQS